MHRCTVVLLYIEASAANPSHPLSMYWKCRLKLQHARQFWEIPPFQFRAVCLSRIEGQQLICVPSIAPRAPSKNGYSFGFSLISLGVGVFWSVNRHVLYKMVVKIGLRGLFESICQNRYKLPTGSCGRFPPYRLSA